MRTANRRSLRAHLALRIRVLRIVRGWSQEQLADYCGLHRTYIGAVERAERNITVDNIEKIALALGVTAGRLFGDGDLLQWPDTPDNNCIEEPRVVYRITTRLHLPARHRAVWQSPAVQSRNPGRPAGATLH